ncbi:MAG: hypothetical protein EA359_11255 [Balneolaceae bacterium]|nr:MAG: hypothetical protein EA359_11255 [Balneolaceae bacterium]
MQVRFAYHQALQGRKHTAPGGAEIAYALHSDVAQPGVTNSTKRFPERLFLEKRKISSRGCGGMPNRRLPMCSRHRGFTAKSARVFVLI